MEAEKVRELTACLPTQVDRVAKKLNVRSSLARGVRLQFIRLLSGKCVFCGMKKNCCKAQEQARVAQTKPLAEPAHLLEELDPQDILLQRKCMDCEKPFTITVGRILKAYKRFGTFEMKTHCDKCREKYNRKYKKERQEEQEDREEHQKEPEKDQLRFRPFRDLKMPKK